MIKVITYIFGNGKCYIMPVFVIRKLRLREATTFIQNDQLVWELGWRSSSDSHISESVWHKMDEQLMLEEHSSLRHTCTSYLYGPCIMVVSYTSNCECPLEEGAGVILTFLIQYLPLWNLFFRIYILKSRKYPSVWNTSEF